MFCMHACFQCTTRLTVLNADKLHPHLHNVAYTSMQYMELITSYDDDTVEALPTRIKAAMMRSGQW